MEGMNMKMRTFMICLMALAVLGGCSRHEGAGREAPALEAQTMEVQLQRVPDTYEAVGTVRSKVTATVSAKVMASIQHIRVKAGDSVRAGEELASLDDRDMRAEYERARADFLRYKALLESQAATPAEFDAVQSRYRVAEANVSYASITAPFDGVVGQKLCEEGDLASPGKALFVVEQPADFRLEVQVPERLASAVGLGNRVRVSIDATEDDCAGTVAEADPVGDPSIRSFLVKIDLRCGKPLKSGMFGRAQFVVGQRSGLFLPRAVIHERGQLTFLFVVADGHAHMRLVKTGNETPVGVEVLSGLQLGERVITNANGELSDGSSIREK
jgi:RND family efflux transporter MFP subunit